MLAYKELLKLVGLGWIEYTLPFVVFLIGNVKWIQFSIDIKNISVPERILKQCVQENKKINNDYIIMVCLFEIYEQIVLT